MPRNQAKTDADALLPYLSTTPAEQVDLMEDLDWTLARLEEAFYAVRRMGIRLDTRDDRCRVCPSSWDLCFRKALEADY